MTTHRTTRDRVSNPPTTDNPATCTSKITHVGCGGDCPYVDDTLYVTTDGLGRADAFTRSAERLIEAVGVGAEGADEDGEHDDDSDPGRIRNNLAYLIESAKLAIREAQYAHGQTVAAFEAHR